MRRATALLTLALALGACDRQMVTPIGSSLLGVEPDLSVVRLDPDLTLRLRRNGLEGPLDVTVNGERIPFDTLAGVYLFPTTLSVGLNRFDIAVTDDAGLTRRDSLFAVHLPLQNLPLVSPQTGSARAGAAAVALQDGRILLTGGVGTDGRALGTATLLQPGGARIDSREVTFGTPRAAHTASVLPDGQVLLIGGALADRPTAAGEFVDVVEVAGATATSVTSIPVEGGAPRRARHTTHVLTVTGTTYVYLYGGLVPAGSGTTISGTVDVYRLDTAPDLRLVRLSPEGGAGAFERTAGHVMASIQKRTATVLGRNNEDDPVAFSFLWQLPGTPTYPFELRAQPLPDGLGTRTDAAAVDLGTAPTAADLLLVVGGRIRGEATGSLEVVAPAVGRSFRFPSDIALTVPRSGHTATILPNRRIVVLGGRSASGTPLATFEAFAF